ncbi:MAG: hypothetical protein HFJ40_07315 [Clostridia bacterium]|nr:hypothetical protein [Clostridia bacterium]
MVNNACMRNTKPVTRKLVDEMTNEIYSAVENNNEISININLQNEVGSRENRSSATKEVKGVNREPSKSENRGENRQEERREDRQFRNRGLSDLIRILLIRELLGRPNFPGNRPPFRPGRPPFPGGGRPPFPGGPGRPPIMPRGYDSIDLYEQY